jgi:hypothetical protein
MFIANVQRIADIVCSRDASWDVTYVKVGKFPNMFSGTWRPTISIRAQQSVLLLETVIRNRASRFFRLE